MVAPNPTIQADEVPSPPFRAPGKIRSALHGLVESATNVAKLQKQILVLKAKILVKKVVLSAILGTGIFALGLIGLIFLYIFAFKALTDLAHIPAVWVWLIFAGVHVLAASIMALGLVKVWHEPKPAGKPKPKAIGPHITESHS